MAAMTLVRWRTRPDRWSKWHVEEELMCWPMLCGAVRPPIDFQRSDSRYGHHRDFQSEDVCRVCLWLADGVVVEGGYVPEGLMLAHPEAR